jgi:hypothetical protein
VPADHHPLSAPVDRPLPSATPSQPVLHCPFVALPLPSRCPTSPLARPTLLLGRRATTWWVTLLSTLLPTMKTATGETGARSPPWRRPTGAPLRHHRKALGSAAVARGGSPPRQRRLGWPRRGGGRARYTTPSPQSGRQSHHCGIKRPLGAACCHGPEEFAPLARVVAPRWPTAVYSSAETGIRKLELSSWRTCVAPHQVRVQLSGGQRPRGSSVTPGA